jgi:putative phosphoesterase
VIIGIIADTHGLVRPELPDVFEDVDLILHAGDVGGSGVLEALQTIAPVEAVYGNVDDPHDPALARERVVTVAGLTIHVSHGHELGRPTAQLALARYAGDVVVFGHTHRPVTYIAPDGRVAVNPGAAGLRRFDLKPSVAKLTLPLQVQITSLA